MSTGTLMGEDVKKFSVEVSKKSRVNERSTRIGLLIQAARDFQFYMI